MMGGLMTIDQFCERHSISRATFYRMVKDGDLKAYKVRGDTRISEAQEAEWISSLPLLEVR